MWGFPQSDITPPIEAEEKLWKKEEDNNCNMYYTLINFTKVKT